MLSLEVVEIPVINIDRARAFYIDGLVSTWMSIISRIRSFGSCNSRRPGRAAPCTWLSRTRRAEPDLWVVRREFYRGGIGRQRVCVGGRYRIGGAEFEVSQPRSRTILDTGRGAGNAIAASSPRGRAR